MEIDLLLLLFDIIGSSIVGFAFAKNIVQDLRALMIAGAMVPTSISAQLLASMKKLH